MKDLEGRQEGQGRGVEATVEDHAQQDASGEVVDPGVVERRECYADHRQGAEEDLGRERREAAGKSRVHEHEWRRPPGTWFGRPGVGYTEGATVIRAKGTSFDR